MTTFRMAHKANYTVLHNDMVTDSNLTFAARGMLSFLLSKPDNWKLSRESLTRESPGGETVVRHILKELEDNGYLQRSRVRTQTGSFRWFHDIYEHPSLNPQWHNPPHVENPPVDCPRSIPSTEDQVLKEREIMPTAQKTRKLTPQQEIIEAIADAFSLPHPTKMGRAEIKPIAVAAASILSSAGSPREVADRKRAFERKFSYATCTPMALAKWWSSLSPDINPAEKKIDWAKARAEWSPQDWKHWQDEQASQPYMGVS